MLCHSGTTRTEETIRQHLTRPGLCNHVLACVQTCDVCQRWENTYYRKNILQYIIKITYFFKLEYWYAYLLVLSHYLLKYYCAGPSIFTYYCLLEYLLLRRVISDKYSVFKDTFRVNVNTMAILSHVMRGFLLRDRVSSFPCSFRPAYSKLVAESCQLVPNFSNKHACIKCAYY